MNTTHSDALVFFGATGDLAYKKIFPSLQSMIKRGSLNQPIVCDSQRGGWDPGTNERSGPRTAPKTRGVHEDSLNKLFSLMHYVDGDYEDLDTLRKSAQNWEIPKIPLIIWLFRRNFLKRL